MTAALAILDALGEAVAAARLCHAIDSIRDEDATDGGHVEGAE